MRPEDWLIVGLIGFAALIYLGLRAAIIWQKYELMKAQLDSAVSNLRTGYMVTKQFTKIIASIEMTGQNQSIVVTKEFSDAMFKVERHLRETLELLEQA